MRFPLKLCSVLLYIALAFFSMTQYNYGKIFFDKNIITRKINKFRNIYLKNYKKIN